MSETSLPASAQVLLDAVIAITSASDMHDVLAQIVVSSCELTDAQYGALGVIGEGGTLSAFITHGISESRPRTHRRSAHRARDPPAPDRPAGADQDRQPQGP